ncbi:hypothetical protein ZIOFF_012528 [Zingiber officinale]|uniref:DUF4005 domain-containing protein n=1 Tax=Zingiber officinale TaxID=94328 RepID=A0A8J5I7M6_ZINOF|nr:hypothetical protein ZIOFF_012528 [Zingiber officinale]
MGKPASSCLKIMGCGGGGADAVDNGDLLPEEAQATTSSDNRRWSFRRRSSKHRVLSNTVVSEPISVCSSKESQELPTANLQSAFPEVVQEQEKPIKTSLLPSEISNTEAPLSLSSGSISPVGPALSESIAIIFQAVIRGNLAREEVHKLKCIVKLQAIVRGYLVRRQAIGTLQCIQAIIRMQALVRARHTRQLFGKSRPNDTRKFLGKGDSFNKPGRSAINKLLTNGLAHQLLETTPRKKTIHIKCDPSESDSVWKWLKRWTAIASSANQQPVKSFGIGHQVLEGKTNVAEGIPKKAFSNAALSVLSEPVLPPTKLMMADDDEQYLMIGDADGLQCQTSVNSQSNSFNFGEAEKLQPGNDILDTTVQDYAKPKVVNDERLDCIDDTKQAQPNKNSGLTGEKSPVRKDCFNHDTEKASPEMLEDGGKKIAASSRKPCNPAFVAAQSKLEQLSSKSTVGRPVSSAYQNASSKSKSENQNIHTSSFTENHEAVSAKTSIMYDSRLQTAASECGTEISITSTLDSPDRSDMEGGEIVLEISTLENKNYGIVEENALELPSLSGNGRPEDGDDNVANSNVSINLTQSGHKSTEPTSSSAMTHQEVTTEQGRSLEGTPVNYESAADAHGTPSSDISVNARKKKKDDNMSTYRQRLQLVGKNLSSSPINGSGVQISVENLVKDPKIPKRRNSFGMAKTDHVEQEPRLSSSNSLPSYMQATASARAKAYVSTSQKSSPDQQDNHPKKRHSLPVENGKQSSSPRMQRSASQAQPNGKANGVHSPHTSAGKLLLL